MEHDLADTLFRMAERLDNSAREVTSSAARIAAGMHVDPYVLAGSFNELADNSQELLDALMRWLPKPRG